jgi:hypothetical protein
MYIGLHGDSFMRGWRQEIGELQVSDIVVRVPWEALTAGENWRVYQLEKFGIVLHYAEASHGVESTARRRTGLRFPRRTELGRLVSMRDLPETTTSTVGVPLAGTRLFSPSRLTGWVTHGRQGFGP